MTKIKKIVAIGTMALVVSAMSISAFAATTYKTPAEAVAGLTGKSVESVTAEKQESGKTYGTIAKDAGKLEEFKAAMLEAKKEILAKKVADGIMTQERADQILAAIKENQASCDGTGSSKVGRSMGAGFGSNGGGQGQGKGQCGGGQGRCGTFSNAQ